MATRVGFSEEEEASMWRFFVKKLQKHELSAMRVDKNIWVEYSGQHEDCRHTSQSFGNHFRRRMLSRLSQASISNEDIDLILQLCDVKMPDSKELNELKNRLHCDLRSDNMGFMRRVTSGPATRSSTGHAAKATPSPTANNHATKSNKRSLPASGRDDDDEDDHRHHRNGVTEEANGDVSGDDNSIDEVENNGTAPEKAGQHQRRKTRSSANQQPKRLSPIATDSVKKRTLPPPSAAAPARSPLKRKIFELNGAEATTTTAAKVAAVTADDDDHAHTPPPAPQPAPPLSPPQSTVSSAHSRAPPPDTVLSFDTAPLPPPSTNSLTTKQAPSVASDLGAKRHRFSPIRTTPSHTKRLYALPVSSTPIHESDSLTQLDADFLSQDSSADESFSLLISPQPLQPVHKRHHRVGGGDGLVQYGPSYSKGRNNNSSTGLATTTAAPVGVVVQPEEAVEKEASATIVSTEANDSDAIVQEPATVSSSLFSSNEAVIGNGKLAARKSTPHPSTTSRAKRAKSVPCTTISAPSEENPICGKKSTLQPASSACGNGAQNGGLARTSKLTTAKPNSIKHRLLGDFASTSRATANETEMEESGRLLIDEDFMENSQDVTNMIENLALSEELKTEFEYYLNLKKMSAKNEGVSDADVLALKEMLRLRAKFILLKVLPADSFLNGVAPHIQEPLMDLANLLIFCIEKDGESGGPAKNTEIH